MGRKRDLCWPPRRTSRTFGSVFCFETPALDRNRDKGQGSSLDQHNTHNLLDTLSSMSGLHSP